MTEKELKAKYPTLAAVPDIAAKNHVYAAFWDHNDATYLVVTPNFDYYEELIQEPQEFEKIVKENETRGELWQNMYYGTYKIDDNIRNMDIFKYHNNMCDMIQHESVAKNCYWGNGYLLPKYMNEQSLCNLRILQEKAHSAVLPSTLKSYYEEAIKKEVAWQSQYFGNIESKPLVKTVPFHKHEVSKNYFFDNGINATNAEVNNYFLDFLKKHIEEHPDFVYYLDKKPFYKQKDLSKNIPEDQNYFKDQIELKEYHITFPKSQDKYFFEWLIRYNCRDFDKSMVASKGMLNSPSGNYICERIPQDDMRNINSLCTANNIKFAVKLDDVNYDDFTSPTVIWRYEDQEMVTAILKRLLAERDQLVPMYTPDFKKAEQNKPTQYHNPFFTCVAMKNAIEQNQDYIKTQIKNMDFSR